MKFLIEGKFLIQDPHLLDLIKEVKEVGSYGEYKYEVLGEPERVQAIKNDDIIDGDESEVLMDRINTKKLEEANKELDKFKLKDYREKAVARLFAEKRKGLTKQIIQDYVQTVDCTWSIQNKSTDDCVKWLNEQEDGA